MIYLRAAASALGASGLLTKFLVGLGLVAALLAAYGVWHHKVYTSGYERAIEDVGGANPRNVTSSRSRY